MEDPPKLAPVDLDKYQKLRADFTPQGPSCISFYCSPKLGNRNSTNTQCIPPPSADRLADVSDDELRATVALSFLRVGIGQEVSGQTADAHPWTNRRAPVGNWDSPPGRQAAYVDVV